MKKQNGIFTINRLTRGNNSIYGNPSYWIDCTDEHGNFLIGKTASNAAIGYALSYSHEGRTVSMQYHYTASGNLIFDYLNN